MLRWSSTWLALAVGCGAGPTEVVPPSPSPIAELAEPVAAVVASEEPGDPALILRNPSEVEITIHGAYVVDADGARGTLSLWPDPHECPEVKPPRLGAGESRRLAVPARAHGAVGCEPTEALVPGDYVLRLDSGYGETFYASAPLRLPLEASVELTFGPQEPLACDPALARRAARLVFAAARTEGLGADFERDCDVEEAGCGALPLDDALPPTRCTITLHDQLLRIHRAAGDDTPRWLTAWLDGAIVYAQRPSVDRTSASQVVVGGDSVVVAGTTSRHRHVHGGAAARIGAATFRGHNASSKALSLRVVSIEYLVDHDCGLPNELRAKPVLRDVSTTTLAPGQSEITVRFEPQGAYQVHCDRFATRVTFEVGGKRVVATSEHEVMRFDPLR